MKCYICKNEMEYVKDVDLTKIGIKKAKKYICRRCFEIIYKPIKS